MILEAGLHPTVAQRMQRNLRKHGVTHRVEGDAILVPDDDRHREAIGLMDLLLDCHERILHYGEPTRVRPYKPLERDVIIVATLDVLAAHRQHDEAFLADLLHALVWAQGLPNTNHRSTLSLVNRLAFPGGRGAPPMHANRRIADAFIAASKPLIREKEFAPAAKELQAAHLAIARTYVQGLFNQPA